MGTVQAVRIVDAPIQQVWNCLNDIEHTSEWVVGLDQAEIQTPKPYGVGAIYHDINRIGPIRQITFWHVIVFEPTTCQVHISDSSTLPSRLTFNLSPSINGTFVQLIVDYRLLPNLGSISFLAEKLFMNRILRQMLRKNLIRLNSYLKTHTPAELEPVP